MFNKALFWIFVWFLKTWKKSSPLSEIEYIFVHEDTTTSAGGVATYIKVNINYSIDSNI